MLNRRQFGQLIGAGAVGAALAQAPATFAQDGQPLRLATNTSDLASLDPHFATGTQDRTVVDMVFNALIRFVPGTTAEFEPDLAEDMPEVTENDDDTQSWSFTVREGVMTHAAEGVESTEISVNDVLFSFQKAQSQDTSAFSSDYIGWTFEADEAARTFRITVPEPTTTALFYPRVTNYSGGFIVPQAAYEALGTDGYVTGGVGTGPFAVTNYTPQNSLELTAHADYWRGAPQLAGVTVLYLPDITSREAGLQAGDIDVIRGLPEASWAQRMGDMDGYTTDVFGVGEVCWFNLNTEHEILKDVKVREAIIKAISREGHMALSGEPISSPVYSVIPADFMPGGLTEEQAEEAGVNYSQDIEGAKALLEEAGYPDGFELDLVTSEQIEYRANYEVLQEELRQIGITVNLEVVQHATMHELIREDRNAITIYNAYRPTPDMYLTAFFSSEGGGTNFSKLDLLEYRDRARAETDEAAQDEIWREASIEILKSYAGYGIFYLNQVYTRRDAVDYGHELDAVLALYPGIDETTTMTE
jgi:peptide/nickel transport system substrate-binding protein